MCIATHSSGACLGKSIDIHENA
eukprot:COSAG06_NODE_45786_length_352_cov_0.636364_1_plen_22_part_10